MRIDTEKTEIASRACNILLNMGCKSYHGDWPNTPGKLRRLLKKGKLYPHCFRGYGKAVHAWVLEKSKL